MRGTRPLARPGPESRRGSRGASRTLLPPSGLARQGGPPPRRGEAGTRWSAPPRRGSSRRPRKGHWGLDLEDLPRGAAPRGKIGRHEGAETEQLGPGRDPGLAALVGDEVNEKKSERAEEPVLIFPRKLPAEGGPPPAQEIPEEEARGLGVRNRSC